MSSNTETILIFFVAFTGAAVLLQACILLAIFISLRKAAKSALEATQDLKATIVPMVHTTRELVERITPQVVTVSAGLAELTETLKRESSGVQFSVSEILERVSRQVQRLDAMLTVGLNGLERATGAVETAVSAPVRQVNGVLAAIRAVIETYRADPPGRKSNHSDLDDMRRHQ